jgi:hypothetical protein
MNAMPKNFRKTQQRERRATTSSLDYIKVQVKQRRQERPLNGLFRTSTINP